ncbi:MAG: hypothetical protein Q9160_001596 [Pyrenula sp. 1 TL-2023]
MQIQSLSLLAALLAPISVSAHGHVTGIVANGVWYPGWNPAYQYSNPVPKVAGWASSNLDEGFVTPDAFSGPDIICHKSATPGQAYVKVTAGSKITLQWLSTWPVSHKGPVLDYLAACNGECTTVDKTKLSFIKLDAGGWISGSNPGTWATDTLVANNVSWTTTVPSNLKAGNYVLRHEIIALHAAQSVGGAQAYPQCINLQVTGTGTAVPSGGVSAATFYKSTDPGIVFNIYTSFTSYQIPGPAVKAVARKMKRHAREFLETVWQ